MNASDVDTILRAAYEDQKLSRKERHGVSELLEGARARDFDLFRSRVFALCREWTAAGEGETAVQFAERLVQLAASRERGDEREGVNAAYFSPGDSCLRAIRGAIENARKFVDVCVFTLTDDRITERLLQAQDRGLRVRLITDDLKSEDKGSDVDRLARAGVQVRVDESDKHMHHKFALFDDRVVLTGSYNWTRSAAAHNEENIVISDDQTLIRAFRGEFDQLWNEFR